MLLRKTSVMGIFLLLTLSRSLIADTQHDAWLDSLPKPWLIETHELAKILPEFQTRFPDYHDRLQAIARWRIGTPYKIFNLGEEQEPDPDPLFRLDVSDCTSHILTSLSLAQSSNWEEARDRLTQIHYKPDEDGKRTPDYKRRWHYTSDRILNHPSTPHITHHYASADELKTVEVTLNRKQDGTEFLALDWSLPVRVSYVPTEHITENLLSRLPDLVGVAFVKESYFKMGIVTAHEGMLIAGSKILHAGQAAEETVIEEFMPYYFNNDGAKFDGIMLYEFVPQTD